MIDIKTLIPIIAITATSMAFKETRWLGIVALAAISYFYPMLFAVAGTIGGAGYLYYRHQKK